MTQTAKQKKVRPGVPCSEESLKDHLKSFSDMDECFARLNKQQSSLLTKTKKCATVKTTKKTTKETKCVNRTSTRKKSSKE